MCGFLTVMCALFMINFFKSDEEGKENVSDAFSFEI